MWSRALAPGYLDHPPMVALWIRAGTWLAGDGAVGIRLLSPLAAAAGTWLLFRATMDLLPGPDARSRGLTAAGLMNATLLFGVGSVTMTPDTPLLFFWTACLAALGRLLATGRPAWWIAAGVAAGLALDSKYTAVLLAPGLLAWVLIVPSLRPHLARPWIWGGALVALGLFVPVLAWNAAHGWASFAKQGGRAGDWRPERAAQFLAELIGGQIGLATPLVALLCAAGAALACRRLGRGDAGWSLLATLSMLPAAVFAQHALGDRVQANWPAIIYPSACICAASLGGWWRRLARPAMASGLLLAALVWAQGIAAPLPLPRRFDPTLMRLGGWRDFAADIAARAASEQARFVAADNYGDAAILARLLPADLPVVGAEARWGEFTLPRAELADKPGLLVRSARRADPPDPLPWRDLAWTGDVARARDGAVAETFHLYRVTGGEPRAGLVTLPRLQGETP